MTTITATWTIDDDVNYSDDLVVDLAKEIQEELDNEMMISLLVQSGWTNVPFKYKTLQHAVDVMDWCTVNFETAGLWQRLNGSFVFSRKEDAEWFILRWL